MAAFVVMHFVPGGPIERQIMRYKMAVAQEAGRRRLGQFGIEIPPEALEEMKRFYGFDKPLHIRYARGCGTCFTSISARSYIYQDPVWDVIKSRFPISIFLGMTGFLLELSRLRAARRVQGRTARLEVRFLQQLHRLSRLLDPGLGARHRAARAVRRRQLLELSFRSAGFVPTTGNT